MGKYKMHLIVGAIILVVFYLYNKKKKQVVAAGGKSAGSADTPLTDVSVSTPSVKIETDGNDQDTDTTVDSIGRVAASFSGTTIVGNERDTGDYCETSSGEHGTWYANPRVAGGGNCVAQSTSSTY